MKPERVRLLFSVILRPLLGFAALVWTAYEEDIATKINGSDGGFFHYSDSGVRDYARSASFGYASSERDRSYRCKTESTGKLSFTA